MRTIYITDTSDVQYRLNGSQAVESLEVRGVHTILRMRDGKCILLNEGRIAVYATENDQTPMMDIAHARLRPEELTAE